MGMQPRRMPPHYHNKEKGLLAKPRAIPQLSTINQWRIHKRLLLKVILATISNLLHRDDLAAVDLAGRTPTSDWGADFTPKSGPISPGPDLAANTNNHSSQNREPGSPPPPLTRPSSRRHHRRGAPPSCHITGQQPQSPADFDNHAERTLVDGGRKGIDIGADKTDGYRRPYLQEAPPPLSRDDLAGRTPTSDRGHHRTAGPTPTSRLPNRFTADGRPHTLAAGLILPSEITSRADFTPKSGPISLRPDLAANANNHSSQNREPGSPPPPLTRPSSRRHHRRGALPSRHITGQQPQSPADFDNHAERTLVDGGRKGIDVGADKTDGHNRNVKHLEEQMPADKRA
ncbi:carbon/nitrogen insensitive 1 [Striga asiatica]|uniref:Carbon/nitrogen insensitive 1 n=1 Tax=Striga asiatica TaxID=4170 RepID=A0A5A7QY34_STRAF|nr:carbon/nitrogen insensitive 1 [Striga asiatica]